MTFDHVIKNGTVVAPDRLNKADVYLKDGKIAAVTSEALEGDALEVTDATGKYVFPGFIDTHVHSRDGRNGAHYKEDFFHSSLSAIASGVTTIYEMPNSNPAVYNVDMLNDLVATITPKAHTDFGVWGLCLGSLNNGELAALADAGVVGFKFFWGYAVDKSTYQLVYNYKEGMENVLPPFDEGEIYEIFEHVAKTGKLIGIHAENFALINKLTERNRGENTYAAMLRSRPAISETTVISTAIDFAKATGAHLHILHLAAGDGVDLIREAQQKGIAVTGETCPHYLALTDEDGKRLGSAMKGYPPVRTRYDQAKLWQGLLDGTLTHVCSDHAPHTPEEKQKGLWEAPAGMASIETMSMIMLDAAKRGKLSLCKVARLLCSEPARLFSTYPVKGVIQPGADGDIAIVDMMKERVFSQESLHSRTKLSPYDGRKYFGTVEKTILRGSTVFANGEVVGEPRGRFIRAHN